MTIIVPSARSSSVSRTPLNGQNPAALYVLKRWASFTSFHYAKLLSIWSDWRRLSLFCRCNRKYGNISDNTTWLYGAHHSTLGRLFSNYGARNGLPYSSNTSVPFYRLQLGIRSSDCSCRAATMAAICPTHIMLIRIRAKVPHLFCLYWQVTII